MNTGLRPVPGFPGYYAGGDGRVYSTLKGGLRPLSVGRSSNKRYLVIAPWRDGRNVSRNVHRLVAEAWLGPCPEGMECSHLNGDGTDNRPENLAWETPSRNVGRQVEHGTHTRGHRNAMAKMTPEKLAEVRAALEQGRSQKLIAQEFGIAQSSVSRINCKQVYGEIL